MIYGLDSAVTESQNNKLNIINCISFIDESQQAGTGCRAPQRWSGKPPRSQEACSSPSISPSVTDPDSHDPGSGSQPKSTIPQCVTEFPRDRLAPKGHLALAGTLHRETSAARKDIQKAILPRSQDQAEADQIHTRTEAFKNATVFHE